MKLFNYNWKMGLKASLLSLSLNPFNVDAPYVSCFADQKSEYYRKLREDMKHADKEDKLLDRQRRREKRVKQKMKWKKGDMEEEDEDDLSGSEKEMEHGRRKRSKIYFDSGSDNDSNNDDGERKENITSKDSKGDSITLEEQEALALKLLNSLHS